MGPRLLRDEELKALRTNTGSSDDGDTSQLRPYPQSPSGGENDPHFDRKVAHKYVSQIYAQNMDHITEVFRIHYGIDIGVKITFHDSYPVQDNDQHNYQSTGNMMELQRLTSTSFAPRSPLSPGFPRGAGSGERYGKSTTHILSPRRVLALSPRRTPWTGRIPMAKKESAASKSLRLRRTNSNPIELDQLAFTGKKNIPHITLIESEDEPTATRTLNAAGPDSSDTDQDREEEEGDLGHKSSDTSDENIDYAGLVEESQLKNLPRSPFHTTTRSEHVSGYSKSILSGNQSSDRWSKSRYDVGDKLMGTGGRSESITHTKVSVRILYRYDGWPEPKVINMYKFNRSGNGMSMEEILQQIESKAGDDEEVEYEQLRYATTPTYIHGKRGWTEAFENSFIPFLIGDDGVNEVDIWLRTSEFIHNGVGKQLVK